MVRGLASGARLSTVFFVEVHSFFCGSPQFFSWAVGRWYKLVRPALLLRAAQPVFLHAVTQLLRVHTQQRGRTMHTRDPPVGRLQGR